MPEIWLCPAPGAPDLLDALSHSTDHAPHAVLQVYSHVFTAEPGNGSAAIVGPNTWDAMAQSTYWNRPGHRAGLAVECGAVKPGQSTMLNAAIAIKVCQDVATRGAVVDTVLMDEPLTAALYLTTPPWRMDDAVTDIQRYHDMVRGAVETYVGWVEAYPTVSVEEIERAIRSVSFVPACLHLDLDLNAMKQKGLRACGQELRYLRDWLKTRQIPFGVVIWGCDDRTDAAFAASAKELFATCQNVFGQDWPDRVIVQSWSRDGDNPRRVPLTLPWDGQTSLWGLMTTCKRALKGVAA